MTTEEFTPLSEELFRQIYKYRSPEEEPLTKRIFRRMKCSGSTLVNFFPILKWLRNYKWKSDIIGDLVAGLTVAVMHIPHGLAYASLAGQSPVVGLYMAVFATVIYFFLGTSKHLSLGTFAVLCMMVGKTVSEHGNDIQRLSNVTNNNTSQYTNLEVGITVCFMVGVWQLLMGLLRLGALWVLLSNSLVSGFTTGAATHVVIYQFKNLLGVNTKSFSGPLKLVYIVIDLIQQIPSTNLVTFGLSFCAILILSIFNELLKPLIQKRCTKCRVPVPIELIVILMGIAVSYFLNLEENYDVKIVKTVPEGLPEPVVPTFDLIPSIAIDCLVIAIVGISMCLSLATIFANKSGYEIDSNQELIAYGIGNMFAAFFQCVPASASLSRSLVQHSVGGKSQIASVFTMLTIILLLLFLGPLFEPVPYCVLSSIVVVTLKGLVWQMKDFPGIWRLSKLDGAVWLVTFLSVVFIDLDYGLGVGMIMSVFTLVLRGQFPQVVELGRLPDTNLFLDLSVYKDAEKLENTQILKIIGTLHFANCSAVCDEIIKRQKGVLTSNIEANEKTKRVVILDLSCVPSVDPTAAGSLVSLHKDLDKMNTKLILSHVNCKVYDFLLHCKFFDKFPKTQVMFTISDSLDYLKSN